VGNKNTKINSILKTLIIKKKVGGIFLLLENMNLAIIGKNVRENKKR
jgi:hypothetical protein|tara:strand:+ start:1422 stop:1562 length:141 start_codon:yes stop_codon:yes gene_type:complete